jgi:hypothetical protein
MSTDEKLEIPPFPPGKDPNTGATLIGTTCYSILGFEFTIDHGQYGNTDEMGHKAFFAGGHGPPQLPLAAPFVFIKCAQAFRVTEVKLNHALRELRHQAEKIAELEKQVTELRRENATFH